MVVLQKRSAQARYLAACLALAAMAALPWMTFGSMDLSARLHGASVPAFPAAPADAAASLATPAEVGSPETFPSPAPRIPWIEATLPWLVGGWILGVMAFAIRFGLGWRAVRHLTQVPLPALSAAWQERFVELCQMAGVRPAVRMGETAAVLVPLVVGWMKPVILLPLGVLMQLPTGQVETILLHELAHIRRHDFLVNLLQSVVETLFFYHPAVRSISRRIREERERVCDDLVVEWCRNPVAYAEALTTFETLRRNSLALAATGDGDLLARVRRIVAGVEPRQRLASLFAVAGFLTIGGYLASMFLAPLLAAKVMTDQERITTLAAAQPSNAKLGQYRIFGTVKTEDGRPVPADLQIIAMNEEAQNSAMITVAQAGGSFSQVLSGRLTSLSIWAKGYAPLFVEDFLPKNHEVGPLSLVLKRGFSVRLRFSAPDGKPVAGVILNGTFLRNNRFAEFTAPEMRTDTHGEVMVSHVTDDTRLLLTSDKPDWQSKQRTLGNWPPDHVIAWHLERASPTTGEIMDGDTLRPIAHADILMASCAAPFDTSPRNEYLGDPDINSSSSSSNYFPPAAPLLAHTDENGQFKLDALNQDNLYWIYVRAPGYQLMSLPVRSGEVNLKIKMGRGLQVQGRILDPKGLLHGALKPLQIEAALEIQASESTGMGYRVSEPVNPTSSGLAFSFENLPAGQVTFWLQGRSYPLDLRRNTDDFVINLGQEALPLRTVRIVLDPGAGHAPAGGELVVESQEDDHGNRLEDKAFPVVNDQVSFSVGAPNQLTIYPDSLAGYWFDPVFLHLPAGDKPFVQTIPLLPAGAIRGRVTSDPSLRDGSFLCIPFVVKAAPGLEGHSIVQGGQNSYLTPQDRYVTSPLPFGGIYAVAFWSGANFAVTPPFAIDAEHPIVNSDVHRVAGQTLRGRFVDEANQPIGLQTISMTYRPNESWGSIGQVGTTARDGTFAIPHVNFAVPGYYSVQLNEANWTQNVVRVDGRTVQPLVLVARRKGNPGP